MDNGTTNGSAKGENGTVVWDGTVGRGAVGGAWTGHGKLTFLRLNGTVLCSGSWDSTAAAGR